MTITHHFGAWTVGEQRTALMGSTLHRPVLCVPAGTRRPWQIAREQLRAMGLVNDLMAPRCGSQHLSRWWSAWTKHAAVEGIVALVPVTVKTEALISYASMVVDLAVPLRLVFPRSTPDALRMALDELDSSAAELGLPAPRASHPVDATLSSPVAGLATPLLLRRLAADGRHLETAVIEAAASATVAALADDAAPRQILACVQAQGWASRSDDDLLLRLHGVALGTWRAGTPLELRPVDVLRRSGPALRALGQSQVAHRAAAWMDGARAAAIVLSLADLSPVAACETTVAEAEQLAEQLTGYPTAALRVAAAARREDGAGGADGLLLDETRTHPITAKTVARWVRLAQRDQLLPFRTGPRRRKSASPEETLADMGIRCR